MSRLLLNPRVLAAGCAVFISSIACAQSLNDRIDGVIKGQRVANPSRSKKPTMLGTLVFTEVSVQFRDTPAREAIEYLKTLLGIEIVGRYEDDRTRDGIDPDSEINLDVTAFPALTVLEMILEQCADAGEPCTWQLRNGYVEVGTKDRLAGGNAKEVRFYTVRDLIVEPPQYNNASELDLNAALGQSGGGGSSGGGGGGGSSGGGSGNGGGSRGAGNIIGPPGDDPEGETESERAARIADLIVATIEPDGWFENGGNWASIRYHMGVLIVRTPDFVHRQINGYPFSARRPASIRSGRSGRVPYEAGS